MVPEETQQTWVQKHKRQNSAQQELKRFKPLSLINNRLEPHHSESSIDAIVFGEPEPETVQECN